LHNNYENITTVYYPYLTIIKRKWSTETIFLNSTIIFTQELRQFQLAFEVGKGETCGISNLKARSTLGVHSPA